MTDENPKIELTKTNDADAFAELVNTAALEAAAKQIEIQLAQPRPQNIEDGGGTTLRQSSAQLERLHQDIEDIFANAEDLIEINVRS